MPKRKEVSRRDFLRLGTLATASLIATQGKESLPANQAQPTFPKATKETSPTNLPLQRPNIILIITDDQDARTLSFMPRLQALLVNQGLTFSNSFITTPLCEPSRISILRGQYVHNHQITQNGIPGGYKKFIDMGLENSMINTWLKEAGYRTALIGKYMNQYPGKTVRADYIPPGWDEWYSLLHLPETLPITYFNYKLNENGIIATYSNQPEEYQTDVYARHALNFIQQTTANSQPFFMYIAPIAPHYPSTPAPRHMNEFVNVADLRPPSFDEEDISDKPQYLQNQPKLNSKQIEQIDRRNLNFIRTLLAVDEMLANLIETLEMIGQLQNTFIFFTSDNGGGSSWQIHRMPWAKGVPYEEAIRVPLVVRGPGVLVGQIQAQMVLNIDLAPTIAALAGIDWPEFVDGHSLLPLLGSNSLSAAEWRQSFLIENWEPLDAEVWPAVPPRHQGIRTKDYKYIEYDTGERELYDLSHDPYELQSLHATADPALISQLTSRLHELNSCIGAGCRNVEDAAII